MAAIAGLLVCGVYAVTGDVRLVWCLIVPTLLIGLVSQWQPVEPPARPLSGQAPELALWALAVLCVAITLAANRPNIDDAYYLALATGTADYPQRALYGVDPGFGLDDAAVLPTYYRVLSRELLAGGAAAWWGIPAIDFMHFGLATLAAILMPLAWARLLRLLVPRHWPWVLGALIVVLVMDGAAPTSYGNMSLVRMHQGRTVLLMILLPLASAYAIEVMRTGRWTSWLLLGASLVFAVGANPTGIVVAPAVAGLSAAALWNPSATRSRRLVAVVAAAAYPVLVVAVLLPAGQHTPQTAANWQEQVLHPTDYTYLMSYVVRKVYGSQVDLLFALWVLSAGWCLLPTLLSRRYALIGTLGCWLLFFNPLTAMWAASHPTSFATYWRVLWVAPAPMLMAMVLVSPLWLLSQSFPSRDRLLVVAGAFAIYLLVVPGRSTLSPENDTYLGWPTRKVDDRYPAAAAICGAAGGEAHYVAPEVVSSWVTSFHHHPRPLALRPNYLRAYYRQLGPEEVNRRRWLSAYVSGGNCPTPTRERFAQALSAYDGLAVVCIDTTAPWIDDARAELRSAGFALAESPTSYEVWARETRSPSQSDAAG